MSRNKLNVKKIVIGYLVSPFSASINTSEYDLDELRNHLSDYGWNIIRYLEGKEKELYHTAPWLIQDYYKKILLEKTTVCSINKIRAKEILTGEKFDYIRSNPSPKWDTYSLFYGSYSCEPYVRTYYDLHPTEEDLIEYIEEHIDVEEYRKELQSIKEKSLQLCTQENKIYQQSLLKQKNEKQKIVDLTDRMYSLPDLIKEYHCTSNAKRVILEIVKDESYLVPSAIEELLTRIKNNYNGLNNEEYLSIIGVVLRLQSNEVEKNNKLKKFL